MPDHLPLGHHSDAPPVAARVDVVVFPGYVYGRGYWELQRHAYAFVAPTEVGGTHPVILEALVAGNYVLVNDHASNVETVGDAGLYFRGDGGVDELAAAPAGLLDSPELVAEYRVRARVRARRYSWDAVTDSYERLLATACAGGPVEGFGAPPQLARLRGLFEQVLSWGDPGLADDAAAREGLVVAGYRLGAQWAEALGREMRAVDVEFGLSLLCKWPLSPEKDAARVDERRAAAVRDPLAHSGARATGDVNPGRGVAEVQHAALERL